MALSVDLTFNPGFNARMRGHAKEEDSQNLGGSNELTDFGAHKGNVVGLTPGLSNFVIDLAGSGKSRISAFSRSPGKRAQRAEKRRLRLEVVGVRGKGDEHLLYLRQILSRRSVCCERSYIR